MTEAEWLAGDDAKWMLKFLGDQATDRKLRLYACACCRRVWDSLFPECRDAVAVAERFADGTATDVERNRAFEALTIAGGGMWLPVQTGYCSAFISGLDSGTIAVALAVMLDTEFLCDRMDGRAIAGRGSGAAPGNVGRTALSCESAARLGAFLAVRARAARRGFIGQVWRGLVRPALRVVEGDWPWGRPRSEEYEREYAQQQALLRDIFGNPFRPVTLDPRWLTSDVVALAQDIYLDRAFDRLPILADALQDVGCENGGILSHCRDPQLTHVRGCWVVDLVLGKS
ncbi:MAG TPA: hypothetical protein VKE74_16655 [Gemmataceae bacterium]|nr:hypothetical protein [Gemmataceae bacterium]